MSRPQIVGIRRKQNREAVGGVLTDGNAKLPFVRSKTTTGHEVVAGSEAAKRLGSGTWLPACRLHDCFKAPKIHTLPDGAGGSVRRIVILEFPEVEEGSSEYLVVSQRAKRGEGYVQRFRREDPLIGVFFCRYRMDRQLVEWLGSIEDFMNPTYELLTECAKQARVFLATGETPNWDSPGDTMFQTMMQWWPIRYDLD